MPLSSDIPLSGMRANQQRQAASAHNTANLSTDTFERQRISAQERRAGGVQTRLDTVELSPEARRIARSAEGAQNNVDSAAEATEQIEAREGFKSNARTLQTQDRMLKSMLDALA